MGRQDRSRWVSEMLEACSNVLAEGQTEVVVLLRDLWSWDGVGTFNGCGRPLQLHVGRWSNTERK